MKKKICVLEDDEGIMQIIQILLMEENYEVHGFSNISDFMNANSNHMADLFLLDVMLPDGSGIDVCRRLKEHSKTKQVPVLMMSAHSSIKEITCSCQAEGFLAKPFDIYDFIGKINASIS